MADNHQSGSAGNTPGVGTGNRSGGGEPQGGANQGVSTGTGGVSPDSGGQFTNEGSPSAGGPGEGFVTGGGGSGGGGSQPVPIADEARVAGREVDEIAGLGGDESDLSATTGDLANADAGGGSETQTSGHPPSLGGASRGG